MNILQSIITGIEDIINFFYYAFEFIKELIQFLPQPFLAITLFFFGIWISYVIYKLVKG